MQRFKRLPIRGKVLVGFASLAILAGLVVLGFVWGNSQGETREPKEVAAATATATSAPDYGATMVAESVALINQAAIAVADMQLAAEELQKQTAAEIAVAQGTVVAVEGALATAEAKYADAIAQLAIARAQLKELAKITPTATPTTVVTDATPIASETETLSFLLIDDEESILEETEKAILKEFPKAKVTKRETCIVTGGPYDFAVVDYAIDGSPLDGYGCALAVRVVSPAVQVIGYSRNEADFTRVGGFKDAGAWAWIEKPNPDGLVEMIRELLAN